mgnify:CR=1 FL=1
MTPWSVFVLAILKRMECLGQTAGDSFWRVHRSS